MLERSETGNEIEMPVIKWQLFGRSAVKFRVRQSAVASLDGLLRDVDTGGAGTQLGRCFEPHPRAAADVEESFSNPWLKATRQPPVVMDHALAVACIFVIRAIIVLAHSRVVEVGLCHRESEVVEALARLRRERPE
jgi:hypothetical protein